MDGITEQTVKRSITGSMAKKRALAIACYIAVPVIAIIYILTKKNLDALIFFGGAAIIIQLVIALITYPLIFIKEYDYRLFGTVFTVNTVRNKRYSAKSFEADIKDAEKFFEEATADLSRYTFRHVYRFGDKDVGDGIYGLIFTDKEDKTVKDLVLISPNDKMLYAISHIKRLEK